MTTSRPSWRSLPNRFRGRLRRSSRRSRRKQPEGATLKPSLRISGMQARKQTLEESLARHAYSTESVRRLLNGEFPSNGHHFRPLGVLADFLEVSPGYEEVVEEFLKPELDCVVVEQHAEARSGIAILQAEGTGRSTFFVTARKAPTSVVTAITRSGRSRAWWRRCARWCASNPAWG